ncbi:MAG TPA: arginine decarboxylase, partial [Herpetosiphonaceae bacterium]
IVYHAMVGSQIEDAAAWEARLARSVEAYARVARRVPSLRMFNFGGGMPTSGYDLGFEFDYVGFLARLMASTAEICARYDVDDPMIVAECGRYTVANHNVYLLKIGKIKASQGALEPWYLLNGSLMVSAPDTLIVDQQFVVLPLDRWDSPVQGVRLGGRRTCDSDDLYPRPHQPALPLPVDGEGLVVAVFGVGAYQSMIGGKGGAHHCLNPEMRRIIIEQEGDQLVMREIAPQNLVAMMTALGYNREVLEPVRQPVSQPVRQPAERLNLPQRSMRSSRRRQTAPTLRQPAARASFVAGRTALTGSFAAGSA